MIKSVSKVADYTPPLSCIQKEKINERMVIVEAMRDSVIQCSKTSLAFGWVELAVSFYLAEYELEKLLKKSETLISAT